jgi:hypothetical protein
MRCTITSHRLSSTSGRASARPWPQCPRRAWGEVRQRHERPARRGRAGDRDLAVGWTAWTPVGEMTTGSEISCRAGSWTGFAWAMTCAARQSSSANAAWLSQPFIVRVLVPTGSRRPSWQALACAPLGHRDRLEPGVLFQGFSSFTASLEARAPASELSAGAHRGAQRGATGRRVSSRNITGWCELGRPWVILANGARGTAGAAVALHGPGRPVAAAGKELRGHASAPAGVIVPADGAGRRSAGERRSAKSGESRHTRPKQPSVSGLDQESSWCEGAGIDVSDRVDQAYDRPAPRI